MGATKKLEPIEAAKLFTNKHFPNCQGAVISRAYSRICFKNEWMLDRFVEMDCSCFEALRCKIY